MEQMPISQLTNFYQDHPEYRMLVEQIQHQQNGAFYLKGLSGSAPAVLAKFLIEQLSALNHIFILNDQEEAAYFLNDLNKLFGLDNALFFPSSYKRSIQYGEPESENIVLRTEVLNALRDTEQQNIVVTNPEAVIEKVISGDELANRTLALHKGEQVSIEFINEVLFEYQFERVDFVYEPGQYSIRGGIVDIFSFSSEYPFRIDFFGNEVDTIRSFDVESQLSREEKDRITIIPNIQTGHDDKSSYSFFNILAENTVLWLDHAVLITQRLDQIVEGTDENLPENKGKKAAMIDGKVFMKAMMEFKRIEWKGKSFESAEEFQFDTVPQPAFNKNFELLGKNLIDNRENGYDNFILSDQSTQFERLEAIFDEILEGVAFNEILGTLHEGFVDHTLKKVFFTDHQIFERFHRFRLKKGFSKKENLTVKELNDLKPGDYIVHVDHGIGIFGGLEKVNIKGREQESIKLVYKDSDVLYVSIHSLHRISKYKGKDEETPKVYKLGSGAWQKLKNKTKSRVKDIARDLIQLYAKRGKEKGFSFSPDSYLQRELEASFIYEDTPDQEKATADVKAGMESEYPMDRLVCGDVGFGKTEVAIRAAFKAVSDNKQVVVLVPTTILALQHYHTFKRRMKDFPCSIDYVCRLRSVKDQRNALNKLKSGELDIIIGTHRLVGKDVQFKDLGLLVIDEEQKFGVAVKEKLKQIRVNVDTLTLTATPIPRTLQFSLMGVRDLSIINTPPPNRHPIITEMITLNEDAIREGISYELNRGGQVFFIHNRVQNITEVQQLIKRIVPNARTVVAHGQMNGENLEHIMMDFIGGDYDVLIATTIIENGLDIPNANTIFINNANHFGLSDLHQLRGRVGRSNRKAFCYLIAPPVTLMTQEARRRLKAVEQFSELGSGFSIAMQDLDIRGAGDMLGAEQSGFIADIGFETYQRILNEALQELKEGEFKDLMLNKETDEKVDEEANMQWTTDCMVDTDMELRFPDDYVRSISERMHLYRRLDSLDNEEAINRFENELKDRFGPVPETTKELMEVVRLRWYAMRLGMEKIIMKNERLIIHFVANQDSPFYQSSAFDKILKFIQAKPKKTNMKEVKGKLTLSVDSIKSVHQAIGLLREIDGE